MSPVFYVFCIPLINIYHLKYKINKLNKFCFKNLFSNYKTSCSLYIYTGIYFLIKNKNTYSFIRNIPVNNNFKELFEQFDFVHIKRIKISIEIKYPLKFKINKVTNRIIKPSVWPRHKKTLFRKFRSCLKKCFYNHETLVRYIIITVIKIYNKNKYEHFDNLTINGKIITYTG